jgi:hypothetical protein
MNWIDLFRCREAVQEKEQVEGEKERLVILLEDEREWVHVTCLID